MLKRNNTSSIGLIALFSLCLLVSNLAFAQAENTATGSLDIVVTSNGDPVANAKVIILSWTDPEYTATGLCDANGTLTINNVPAGTIDAAVVNAEGDVLAKASGTVAEDTSRELIIEF